MIFKWKWKYNKSEKKIYMYIFLVGLTLDKIAVVKMEDLQYLANSPALVSWMKNHEILNVIQTKNSILKARLNIQR